MCDKKVEGGIQKGTVETGDREAGEELSGGEDQPELCMRMP